MDVHQASLCDLTTLTDTPTRSARRAALLALLPQASETASDLMSGCSIPSIGSSHHDPKASTMGKPWGRRTHGSSSRGQACKAASTGTQWFCLSDMEPKCCESSFTCRRCKTNGGFPARKPHMHAWRSHLIKLTLNLIGPFWHCCCHFNVRGRILTNSEDRSHSRFSIAAKDASRRVVSAIFVLWQ